MTISIKQLQTGKLQSFITKTKVSRPDTAEPGYFGRIRIRVLLKGWIMGMGVFQNQNTSKICIAKKSTFIVEKKSYPDF